MMQPDILTTIVQQTQQLTLLQKVQLAQQITLAIEQELTSESPETLPRPFNRPTFTKTPLDQITYQIIGCAMDLHNRRGPGYKEHTYQRDLETHFADAAVEFVSQKMLEVYDSVQGNKLLGYYIPDFIVAKQVIVEIKALNNLDSSHIAQTIGYLAASKYPVGLLINFGRHTLEWRRIFPPKDVQAHQCNHQWLFVPDYLRNEHD